MVVALYAEGCGVDFRQRLAAPICTVRVALRRYSPVMGGDNGQQIGYTVFDGIDRSWLWSTAAKSCT